MSGVWSAVIRHIRRRLYNLLFYNLLWITQTQRYIAFLSKHIRPAVGVAPIAARPNLLRAMVLCDTPRMYAFLEGMWSASDGNKISLLQAIKQEGTKPLSTSASVDSNYLANRGCQHTPHCDSGARPNRHAGIVGNLGGLGVKFRCGGQTARRNGHLKITVSEAVERKNFWQAASNRMICSSVKRRMFGMGRIMCRRRQLRGIDESCLNRRLSV